MQRAGLFANLLQLEPDTWREQLLHVVLRVTLVLGTVVCVPSVYMALKHDLYGLAVADVAAIVLVFFLYRARTASFRLRTIAFSFMFYVVGAALLLSVGPIAQVYLLGSSLTATFLLGHRAGFATAALNALTLLVAGVTQQAAPGFVAASMQPDPADPAGWLVVALNFSFINVSVVAITSSVVSTVVTGFERETRAHLSLIQSQAELRERERRSAEQAELLDKAQDAIVVLDLEGRATYLNRRASELYHLDRDAPAFARPDLRPLLAASRDEYDAEFEKASQEAAHTSEHHLTLGAGETTIVERRWTLLRHDSGEAYGVMLIDTDVTEQRRLQDQLIRSQRLESIGTLASGIAHDLNNVLTPILMASDMLTMGESDPDRLADLETIASSARRASDMVRQILGFARGFDGRHVRVDIGAVLLELDRMIRETFPKSIEARVSQPASIYVLGDTTQVTQVLVNLSVNARDAMPTGGVLKVSAERVDLVESNPRLHPGARPGRFVRLRVEDSGVGMDPETLRRIYEPFFTTKEIGKGTGLGLFTTHAIVKAHQGFILVESALGRGTSFDVYLPLMPAVPMSEVVPEHAAARGRGECVLVVDDEEALRTMAHRVLVQHGYQVLMAGQGADGLALFDQHKADIHLVLTDMNMPVMDGRAFIEGLREREIAVPLIAASGLTIPLEQTGVDAKLTKPFTAEALLSLVRKLLDRASDRPGRPV